MSLIDRIATDPVPYAFRLIVWSVLLFLLIAAVYAEDDTIVCNDEICQMKRETLVKIRAYIEVLTNKIEELQAKTGCT